MPLQVNVVSAEREVWSGEAKQVSARTAEGEIGLTANHTPILAMLDEGRVRIAQVDGTTVLILRQTRASSRLTATSRTSWHGTLISYRC